MTEGKEEKRTEEKAGDRCRWHAVYLHYVSAVKVAGELSKAELEYFIPPLVTNLIFIKGRREEIVEFMTFKEVGLKLSFMRDVKSLPVTVRDRSMEMFMRLCLEKQCPIVMAEAPTVKLGDHVRIKTGPLAGIEGRVVRMKKSKRVLINIDDAIWVATEFIRPDDLEVI